jgi:hypothetical protein
MEETTGSAVTDFRWRDDGTEWGKIWIAKLVVGADRALERLETAAEGPASSEATEDEVERVQQVLACNRCHKFDTLFLLI